MTSKETAAYWLNEAQRLCALRDAYVAHGFYKKADQCRRQIDWALHWADHYAGRS